MELSEDELAVLWERYGAMQQRIENESESGSTTEDPTNKVPEVREQLRFSI